MADCIALRSAVATEQATLTAQWSLLIAVGSLCASSAALLGLISAFKQGQRTIGIATDANRIAMEYGRAQARAYVVVQSVEAKLSELGDLTAKVTFQNSGASPARRLASRTVPRLSGRRTQAWSEKPWPFTLVRP